ncbi:MAG: hypothetical protein CVV59_02095 [Tenericutes bacterium HGW-Tenericutes-4]|jgi:hypothetical protein|nr:MAG: hypothetical protein CVV59_02095 [Tenericutes bacterium HGW-Tenericutes-4]
MFDMLLATGLIERLTMTNVILGIALAILGLWFSLLATRVARMVRKTSNVDPNDRVIITMKSFGLILILVALVIIVIK